ncbi:MAG: hypothetical protein ACRD9L_19510 [Bryobacteraceae bacterium]
MATPAGGLAAALYAPSRVKAKVAGDATFEVRERTAYPFGGTVALSISASRPVRFPLALRVPACCEAPDLSVNGERLAASTDGRGWWSSTGSAVPATAWRFAFR